MAENKETSMFKEMRNQGSNLPDMVEFLIKNGWETFEHQDNWIKKEWSERPGFNGRINGLETGVAYYVAALEKPTELDGMIAEFMGATLGNGTDVYPIVYIDVPDFFSKRGTGSTWAIEMLQYHKRWDWLIPVVLKFRELKINHDMYYHHERAIDDAITRFFDINEAFFAVAKAIKWYNYYSMSKKSDD